MKRFLYFALAGLFACAAASAFAQTNLIVNGSFEQPVVSPGGFIVVGSIAGWTTIFGSGIEVENNAVGPAFAGSQLVEMDSNDNSGMQQLVPTIAGRSYTLSVEYSPRPGVDIGSSGIEVRINGIIIDTIARNGIGLSTTSWTKFSYPVVATGSSTAVEFRATGTSDGVGGFIDDVRFGLPPAIPTLSPTVLPGLAGMLALAGVVLVRRRRR
jgi:MYXO-CTERM domain-containing protein